MRTGELEGLIVRTDTEGWTEEGGGFSSIRSGEESEEGDASIEEIAESERRKEMQSVAVSVVVVVGAVSSGMLFNKSSSAALA